MHQRIAVGLLPSDSPGIYRNLHPGRWSLVAGRMWESLLSSVLGWEAILPLSYSSNEEAQVRS